MQPIAVHPATRVRELRMSPQISHDSVKGSVVDLFEVGGCRRIADDVRAHALVEDEILAVRRRAPQGFCLKRQAFLDLRFCFPWKPLFPRRAPEESYPWRVCFSEDGQRAAVVLERQRELRVGDPYAAAIEEWTAFAIELPAYARPVKGVEVAVHYLAHDAHVLSLEHLYAAPLGEASDDFDVIVRVFSEAGVRDARLSRASAETEATRGHHFRAGDFVALFARRLYSIDSAERPVLLWQAQPHCSACAFTKKGWANQSCFRMGEKVVHEGQGFFDAGVDAYRLPGQTVQVCALSATKRELAIFDIAAGTCVARLAHAACECPLYCVGSCLDGDRVLALTGTWLHVLDGTGALSFDVAAHFDIATHARPFQAALSPDGSEVLVLSEHDLRIVDSETGARLLSHKNSGKSGLCCRYALGGRPAIADGGYTP